MASQSDTLALAASVVDQFSAPLASLTRQLKTFSSTQEVVNVRGKRVVEEHWKSYRELALQARYTSENVKKLLTPSVEALGGASLTALLSIKGLTEAMKSVGASAQDIQFLTKETGQSVQQLRVWDAVFKLIHVDVAQGRAGLVGFAEATDQFLKRRGEFMHSFAGGQVSPELSRFLNNEFANAKDNNERVRLVIKELNSPAVPDVEKRQLAEKFKLPPDIGRANQAILEDAAELVGKSTEEQEKSLVELGHAWDRLSIRVDKDIKQIIGYISGVAPYIDKLTEALGKPGGPEGLAAGGAAAAGVGGWIGFKVLKRILGGGGTAAAGEAAGGIGIGGALSSLAISGGAVGGAESFLERPGHALGGSGWEALKRLWGGESGPNPLAKKGASGWKDLFGIGAEAAEAQRPGGALSSLSETPAINLGSELRGQAAIYKGTLQGAKEGVLAALSQWFSDQAHIGGAIGGGAGGGASPGGGGGGSSGAGGGGSRGGGATPSTPGGRSAIAASKSDQSENANLIRKIAREEGIDPDTAVAVAASEGLRATWAGGDKGSSFGPFQAHFGGIAPGMMSQGQGDAMAAEGIDARDPSQKEKVIRWQLQYAKKHGWGEWYGARKAGIGNQEGLGSGLGLGATPIVDRGGAGGGTFSIEAGREGQFAGVDPALKEAMAAAAGDMPKGYRIEAFSGQSATHGDRGSAHRKGEAMDVRIFGPDGKEIPNRGAGSNTGRYRELANHYYQEIVKKHPELANRARWGGNFGTSVRHPNEPDSMHYDLGGGDNWQEDDPRYGHLGPSLRRMNRGLDPRARGQSSQLVKHEGHAKVSIDFRNMPKGIKTAASTQGVFKEVKLNRRGGGMYHPDYA